MNTNQSLCQRPRVRHLQWLLLLSVHLVGCGETVPERSQKDPPLSGGNGVVFDVHMHAIPPVAFTAPARADFGIHRQTAGTNVNDPGLLLQKTIEFMDRNNVRQGLLSGSAPMVKEWINAYPGRFLPSFTPDFTTKDHRAAAVQFEEEVVAGKWRAIGELGLPYQGRPLNDTILFPYYEVAQRHGLPVFFHTGLNGPEPNREGGLGPNFRVELGNPLLLQDVIVRFPELKVVIMHMGWPFADNAIYMLYAYQNVYLDTGVVNWHLAPSAFARILKEAVETGGSERILFGSDQMVWPQMITKGVEAITKADYLTEAEKRRILWENAAGLFKLTQ